DLRPVVAVPVGHDRGDLDAVPVGQLLDEPVRQRIVAADDQPAWRISRRPGRTAARHPARPDGEPAGWPAGGAACTGVPRSHPRILVALGDPPGTQDQWLRCVTLAVLLVGTGDGLVRRTRPDGLR